MATLPPDHLTYEEKALWTIEQGRRWMDKAETLPAYANVFATLALTDQVKRVADLLERSPLERGTLLIGDPDE